MGLITIALSASQGFSGALAPRKAALRGAILVGVTYVLLIMTFAPGYYLLGSEPDERAQVTGVLAVILGAMCLGYLAGRVLQTYLAKAEAAPRWLLAAALATSLLLAIVVLPKAIREFGRTEELSAYAEAWDRRDEQLRAAAAANSRDVRVPLLAHSSDYELGPNPTRWMNQCAASYYGVRTIVAE